MKKEVKNKSPEILGVELGIMTDETLVGIFYMDVSTFTKCEWVYN